MHSLLTEGPTGRFGKASVSKTGDHVSVPGWMGVDHHGIVDNRGRGGTKVIHNAKGVGGIVSSLDEFSGGQPVALVVPAAPGDRLAVADRARQDLGRHYDLFGSNCEHLAFRASLEVEVSPQLRSAAAGTAVVGGAALVTSGIVNESPRQAVLGLGLFFLGIALS